MTTSIDEHKLDEFLDYVLLLDGKEKSEAQLFLDHLFIAFGHKGVKQASAELEYPIQVDTKTKFCDLLWPMRVLIEMKTRGEPLEKHFSQAKTYWDNAYNKRTQYVILCNFDEFWIYNWNLQRDPLDKVPLQKLKEMWRSLAFLCPEEVKPIFGNNRVEVTEEAGSKISELYSSLIGRGVQSEQALHFTLQCLIALFAEDTELFPNRYIFSELVHACKREFSTYDLFPILFNRMNSTEEATNGRFKGVQYFNGGIFSKVYPLDLNDEELYILIEACGYDWSKVQPSIFGNIFESSFNARFRHATGAHYTHESDIMYIVEPTVLRPWREKIAAAKTLSDLNELWEQLSKYHVLDPACGSGNFLYIAFRELKHLEIDLLQKMLDDYPSIKPQHLYSKITCNQFFGIDTNPLGIELAKITLSMAKKFASDNLNIFTKQNRFWHEHDDPLPFDNLDENMVVADALFCDWPYADAIIGNPPYQSKNKMVEEFGANYVEQIREQFPDVPGKADYCVYWFRKAHDMLPEGGRAGLVGTNTISQTFSREGGLDYIVSHKGAIVEAVGTMPWSGSAAVHVAIVNWVKDGNGVLDAKNKRLALQRGEKKDGPWEIYELHFIPPSLSASTDVTKAQKLKANTTSKICFQGQTHGYDGFLLTPEEHDALLREEPQATEVTFPYMISDELFGSIDSQPKRFVIDLQSKHELPEAMQYKKTFLRLKEKVLPKVIEKAEQERERYKTTRKKDTRRQNHLKKWWWLFWRREELITKLQSINRYIACGRVTSRPIFEFVSAKIRPNDMLIVFPFEDDYSFGILQSSFHCDWLKARCSTLGEAYRYTIETIFNTFPWPQWSLSPTTGKNNRKAAKYQQSKIDVAVGVADAARELRSIRNRIRTRNQWSLRELYRSLELPGKNPLKDAHEKLDQAVRQAYLYGSHREMDKLTPLELLLRLNELCATAETEGFEIVAPGLPEFCKNYSRFFSEDCIHMK